MTKIAILTGTTFEFRNQLKSQWDWDSVRKSWTMPVETGDTPESIIRDFVRSIPGIRNRGRFTVRIETV